MELCDRLRRAWTSDLFNDNVLLCPDPHLASAIRRMAITCQVSVNVSYVDRIHWAFHRFRRFITPIYTGWKITLRAFTAKTRFARIKLPLENSQYSDTRTLIVTWIRGTNLMRKELAEDTFFGILPNVMQDGLNQVKIFGDLSDDLPDKKELSNINFEPSNIPIASYISSRDILISIFQAAFYPISVNLGPSSSKYPKLKELIKRDIYSNRAAILYGLFLEKALRAMIQAYSPTHIMHPCENNAWERACSRAATSSRLPVDITGYMHCAVILEHTKILITEREREVRPRPGRIICTGPKAKEILVKHGGHLPEDIRSGAALRYSYMWQMNPREYLGNPVRNILVVLEGLPTMAGFLKFIYESLVDNDKYRIIIRPHPIYPIERVLRDSGIDMNDLHNFSISVHRDIRSDFEETDLVVYKGSTAAMEAGYQGIPVVHVELNNILTDDPLFEIDDFKRVARNPKDLLNAIDEISNMGERQFLQERDALRNYISDYLTQPHTENLRVFQPELNSRYKE